MAREKLAARPAFADLRGLVAANLEIRARDDRTIASIAARRGATNALIGAVQAAYGIALPLTPRLVVADSVTFLWAGVGRWLAMADAGGGRRDLAAELLPLVAEHASLADESDARAIIAISGGAARDCLAKGFPIDFHPRAFTTGDVAITHAAHIGAMIWQTDAAPSYEIAVPRSYAESFAEWLRHAAAEYLHA